MSGHRKSHYLGTEKCLVQVTQFTCGRLTWTVVQWGEKQRQFKCVDS